MAGEFGDSFFQFCLIALINGTNFIIFIEELRAIVHQYLRCALAEDEVFPIFVQPAYGGHSLPVRAEWDGIDHLFVLTNLVVFVPVVVYHLQKSAFCLVSYLLETTPLDFRVRV